MYTETIGKRILEIWRERTSRPEATAREFFDEVFFPLFFDDEQYLLFANNSKFDQASKQRKRTPLTAAVRHLALSDHHTAVEELATRDQQEGHLYLGGYAAGVESATSGLVSDIRISVDEQAIYTTWFGQAASIGVAGGMNVLIDDRAVIERVFDGWSHYRTYLTQTKGLKALQVQTWNAWWLIASTATEYDRRRPFDELAALNPFQDTGGRLSLKTAPWIRVLFALSTLLNGEPATAYVYSFGQLNTSVGFVGLRLDEVEDLAELYVLLFGRNGSDEARQRLKALYETDLGFVSACRSGSIGLQQFRPKGLKTYVPSGTRKVKSVKPDDDNTEYQFYITWLTAMLNNEPLLQKADRLAATLLEFSTAKRAKKTNQALVDKMLESYGLRKFVEAATGIITGGEYDSDEFNIDQIEAVVAEVERLPASQFPLFVTFLRFKYAVKARQ